MLSNIPSEKIILSTLIKVEKLREKYIADINKKHFFLTIHQQIYDIIFDLFFRKEDISDDIIMSFFPDNNTEVQDVLLGVVATDKTMPIHLKNIQEAYYNRQLTAKLSLMLEKIKNGEKIDINSELSNVEIPSEDVTINTVEQQIEKLEKQMEEIKNNVSVTGIPSLDNRLVTSPGDLIVVGARPSMGKTGFIVSVALNKAKLKKGSVIFSLEMPEEKITARALSNVGEIPINEIIKGRLSDYNKYLEAKKKLISLDRWFNVIDSVNNITSICNMITKIRMSNPEIEDFFIDHLGWITVDEDFSSTHHKVGYITKKLKKVAKTTGAKIWLLSQLNRSIENRPNRRPTLSDLRESGSIEEDADTIIGLYREAYYLVKDGKEKEEPNPSKMELIILKQRDGSTGVCETWFNGKYVRVGDDEAAQVVEMSPSIDMSSIDLDAIPEV